MAVVEHAPGWAEVTNRWTGSVSATIGATSATITPTVDSAASVWIALVEKCKLIHGGTWEGWATDAARLEISHTASFTLTASGNTQTRLNLAASASGTLISSIGPHERGYYPTGLGFEGYNLRKQGGAAAADGSGAVPLIWDPGQATLQVFDTWAFNYDLLSELNAIGDLYKMDIWIGGRGLGRYVVESARMLRASKLNDYTTLTVTATGVV